MFQTAGVARSNEEPVVAWIAAGRSGRPLRLQREHDGREQLELADGRECGPRYSQAAGRRPRDDHPLLAARVQRHDRLPVAIDAVEYASATRDRVPTGLPDLEKFLASARHGRRAGERELRPPTRREEGQTRSRCRGRMVRSTCTSSAPFAITPGAAARSSWTASGTPKLFGDNLIDMCHVFLKPGHTAADDAALDEYAAEKGLFVTDQDSLRNSFPN